MDDTPAPAAESTVLLWENGQVRALSLDEAGAYAGLGFLWTHIELDRAAGAAPALPPAIPELAASALLARETRPRCDLIGDAAIINLRGGSLGPLPDGDRLVSIRMWVEQARVTSVSRSPLAAMAPVIAAMREGRLTDPGDLIAALARAISTGLDPEVAALGDDLDDCEEQVESAQIYALRRRITQFRSDAIGLRRFIAPNRDALQTLAGLTVDWLAEDDRLHIREAADRFARMTEELEAVRERAALLHEQLTDMRAELIDERSLLIAMVAFIFLPLTFITGLLGMNVSGIPFADRPWAFWGVVGFSLLVGAVVTGWFVARKWLGR